MSKDGGIAFTVYLIRNSVVELEIKIHVVI